jgi:hypothetical protein
MPPVLISRSELEQMRSAWAEAGWVFRFADFLRGRIYSSLLVSEMAGASQREKREDLPAVETAVVDADTAVCVEQVLGWS